MRLKVFRQEFSDLVRQYLSFDAQEKKMGLKHQTYPELIETKKDLVNMDKLVSLENKFNSTVQLWGSMRWGKVKGEIKDMQQKVSDMNYRCKRLSENLKKISTYTILQKSIADMNELLFVVEDLGHATIRDRHWQEIIQLCGHSIPFESPEKFHLSDIFNADLLRIKGQVEAILETAKQQVLIED